jgi:acetyl-CoA carboxylase carboxyltransferase component
MGPEAAVNAVYSNKIQAIEDPKERQAFIMEKRKEYQADIDLYLLASNLIVDGIVPPDQLRSELIQRFAVYASKKQHFTDRKHPVYPV